MKLTETQLRNIVREELQRLTEDARESERIYNEIKDYLERNGRRVSDGYEIDGIRVGLEGREPIHVKWGYTGESGRWINEVRIGPNGELDFIGSGGSTPYSMSDYYESPEQIIDLLKGDKGTTSNYPT